MADEYKKAIARIADHALNDARRLATSLSQAIGAPESKVLADVLDSVNERRPVSAQLEKDKRASYWRVRLKLFKSSDGGLEADSDPELPLEEPGATVVRGLPGVAEWAGELVEAFHGGRGETAKWLDNATTQKRLKSLRPTLSRKHGKAVWRVDYEVNGEAWRALIDIVREDT